RHSRLATLNFSISAGQTRMSGPHASTRSAPKIACASANRVGQTFLSGSFELLHLRRPDKNIWPTHFYTLGAEDRVCFREPCGPDIPVWPLFELLHQRRPDKNVWPTHSSTRSVRRSRVLRRIGLSVRL